MAQQQTPARRGGRARSVGLLGLLTASALVVGLWMLRRHGQARPRPGLAVEVLGLVERPGWHLVDPPTVGEALRLAGGSITEDEAEQPVTRGDRVEVASDGVRVITAQGHPAVPAKAAPTPLQADDGVAGDGLVDVNRADAAALQRLPGIGPTTAKRIVAERTANGPFTGLADLRRVKGLRARVLEGLEGKAVAG